MGVDLPDQTRVVIVGGGIMGCALAHGLVHEGLHDVVLLEKAELTSGSTWHAAGQVTQSTSSYTLGKCVDYNIRLYAGDLESETGVPVAWHGCGSLRLAYTDDEFDWLHQTLSVTTALGFTAEIISPERIRTLHPFYNLAGVRGALHTPDDGHVDPSSVVNALAAGARSGGANIIRRCRVTGLKMLNDGWRVSTEHGDIDCEHVVNAAGTYARQIGTWNDLQLPMTSMTHHYFVTEEVPEFVDLPSELPVVRDDRYVSGYMRMEQKSGLIGIYEKRNPNAVWVDHCPWEAENELFAPDYERIMPWLEEALVRMPVLRDRGIRRAIHGAISHPPDGNPLIGPAPGVRNYWCCCGTQIGIGWGPALARELARWIVHGAADLSMREFDPRRFGYWATPDWQVEKAREDYCLRHEIPFPNFNRQAGRPIRPSRMYESLANQGAVFEEVYGHERPRWFARNDVPQEDMYSFRRNAVHDMVAYEVRAVRERVGIMDVSAFAKIEVTGRHASTFLDRLVPNRLPQRDGGIVLTHLLNRRGTIEVETTVVRVRQDCFYLVCAAFHEQRLIDHLSMHRAGFELDLINLSECWSALAIQGPLARKALSSVTDAALDNAGFPWLTAREIEIAGHAMRALRVSYTGELGWEIHGDRNAMSAVHNALMNDGNHCGIENYGSFAMNVMRMEKAFKGAGELTNEVTLPEADVMRFVKLDKCEFVGRTATLASMEKPLRWICAYLMIDADGVSDGHGGEAVRMHGRCIGTISSIVYGCTVGKILAFAYMDPVCAKPGTEVDVMIMGEPRRARVCAQPAYDPLSKLPRTDEPSYGGVAP